VHLPRKNITIIIVVIIYFFETEPRLRVSYTTEVDGMTTSFAAVATAAISVCVPTLKLRDGGKSFFTTISGRGDEG